MGNKKMIFSDVGKDNFNCLYELAILNVGTSRGAQYVMKTHS